MKKNSTKKTIRTNVLKGLDPQRCGVDIGASSVYACVADSNGQQIVREFSMFTVDLLKMGEWLKEHGVNSISMESTGVYWIPLFEILDPMGFEVLLVNAHHLKNVPGRKTDVKDCQWLQQLHSHGLLRGSFRPSDDFVRLRAYVRQRRQLFERAAIHIQLMQKAMVQMNIQLHLVLSDVTGKTGMSIIKAIIEGERNPEKLASYRQIRCKRNEKEIIKALEGTWREEHILALRQAYEAYEFYHKQIIECEKAIHQQLPSLTSPTFEREEYTRKDRALKKEKISNKKKLQRKTSCNRSPYYFDAAQEVKDLCQGVDLTQVPGINANTLIVVLSEIGTDMSKWKNVKHFTSWLGLCPGSKISGGKVLSSRTKPTNNRAAHALRLAANSLYRSKTFLGAFFRRMRARLGAPKAITAAAHKLAKIIYRLLKYGQNYQEAGESYYEERYQDRVVKNLRRKAKELGWQLVPIEQN